jgi:hypothetical protein
VSQAQVTALGQLTSTSNAGGHLNVTRLAGADRYGTAEVVDTMPPASNVGSVGGLPTALVANGLTFPDALAGGALAAGAALPIVLTDGSQLPASSGLALKTLGIKQVEILGGTAAVSTAVSDAVAGMGITVNRLSGPDRTETAAAVATFAATQLGFASSGSCGTEPGSPTAVCAFANLEVARGDDGGGGVDALALGPLAGRTKSPILLTASPDDPSAAVYREASFSTAGGALQGLDIVGGPSALSPAIVTFLTVATGGGAHPTFHASPTTVAPGGSVAIDDNGNPCPAAPAGTHGFNVAVLVPLTLVPGTTTVPPPTTSTTTTVGSASGEVIFVFTGPAPLAGGPWRGSITLPGATAPGTYSFVASCAADFAPADTNEYSYQNYSPMTLTVS